MNEKELYHYGIKGMKWGVRRSKSSSGSSKKKTSIRKEDKSVRKNRKTDLKNTRNLSDADLDQRINRLKKEKEFRKLSKEDLNPGRTAVKNFMGTVGSKVLTAAAVGAVAYAGKAYISDQFNAGELANYMFANPNKKK